MKLCIHTLGCKVNAYESECIEEEFVSKGYEVVHSNEEADVIVVNTCTVTNQADAKSRKIIRQSRRENNKAVIVVCGCSSEQHKDAVFELGADIVLGSHGKAKIYSLVQEFIEKREPISLFSDMRKVDFEDMSISKMDGRTRGFVKIEDGCNNFCSFCIIPFMRGRVRSKDFDVAVEEINTLANNGYQEIVLTGIHTGAYGEDKDYDLVDLIREISKNDNLKRIRISSIEITELKDKFMEEFKNNKKICSQMHVPVQCPNDEILKLMNRKYTLDEYKAKIKELREAREDVNITTDLIVGFPGETDEIFNSMLDECVNIGFSKIHTFPYSIRKGTAAEKMEGHLPDKVKEERAEIIKKISAEKFQEFLESNLNTEQEVLIEKHKDKKNGLYKGITRNYINVLTKTGDFNSLKTLKLIQKNGDKIYAE